MFVCPGIPRGLVLNNVVIFVVVLLVYKIGGQTLFLKYALNLFVKMPV